MTMHSSWNLKKMWYGLGMFVVLLFLTEAMLDITLYFGKFITSVMRSKHAVNASEKQPKWTSLFFQEFDSVDSKWSPYTVWRIKPFSGSLIHIDNNGLRHTWNAPGVDNTKQKPIRIFIFGGSTIFGYPARDDATIPSIVSKLLAKQFRRPVEVTNFGQVGYVSSQEMISLIEQIKENNTPSFAIFCDGGNDVLTAFMNHQAGLVYNNEMRNREFDLLTNKHEKNLYKEAFLSLVHKLGIFRVSTIAKNLLSRHSDANELSPDLPYQTAEVYASNVKFVEDIAKAHQFTTLFYLQPVLYEKNRLTPNEAQLAADHEPLKEFYLKSYNQLRKSALMKDGQFHDISKLFNNRQEEKEYFQDFIHINEAGNEIIAKEICKDLVQNGDFKTEVRQ